ncbi:hypothetical protein [Nocardioides sp. zg-DK7169]|uniref:hypothetical protein n=1 Tax=Nocardioides sp. zg-DK7169 TaxID=2736600 RepID=UPI001555FAE2|nr:hypothetical protein [Nocardioides sp. zg-DK7169]NPC95509.1 hypothetical protein [Nocardioides sp. zg-DK7169]
MPARLVATRRATLVGLTAGVLVTTGCDLDDLDPRPVPDPVGNAPAQEPDAAGDAGDTGLVDAAVSSLVATLALVESVRGGDAALRRAVVDLDRLHRAHLADLDPDGTRAGALGSPSGSEGAGGADVPGAPDGVGRPGRRALVAQEQAHRATLAELAGRASSGALAGALASMAAAVAQRLAQLSSGSSAGSSVGAGAA